MCATNFFTTNNNTKPQEETTCPKTTSVTNITFVEKYIESAFGNFTNLVFIQKHALDDIQTDIIKQWMPRKTNFSFPT